MIHFTAPNGVRLPAPTSATLALEIGLVAAVSTTDAPKAPAPETPTTAEPPTGRAALRVLHILCRAPDALTPQQISARAPFGPTVMQDLYLHLHALERAALIARHGRAASGAAIWCPTVAGMRHAQALRARVAEIADVEIVNAVRRVNRAVYFGPRWWPATATTPAGTPGTAASVTAMFFGDGKNTAETPVIAEKLERLARADRIVAQDWTRANLTVRLFWAPGRRQR